MFFPPTQNPATVGGGSGGGWPAGAAATPRRNPILLLFCFFFRSLYSTVLVFFPTYYLPNSEFPFKILKY